MIVDDKKNADKSTRRVSQEYNINVILIRTFGWSSLAVLCVFLINNFLTIWIEWPGTLNVARGTTDVRPWIQAGFYAAAILIAGAYVLRNQHRTLSADSRQIFLFNSFLIRSAFWAVLLIGLIDVSFALLRSEELLKHLAGETLGLKLTQADFRGTYVHMPIIALSIVIALFTRTLGVIWFALLIVISELLIVMFRFIFSFEQVYMTDLVRFWYAPIFLFGCAYTLREEGHVRVDVFYANFSSRTKGLVNALGTLLFGMPFCWLILVVGLSGKTGIINSALLGFEIEGLGDGMYVLYLMSVFTGFFAITMLIEFVGFLFNAVADYWDHPSNYDHIAHNVQ